MRRVLLFAAFAAAAAHAEKPTDYAFGVEITPVPGAAFQRVNIPGAVYSGAADRNLADMRVFNADGEPVPFAFVPVVPPAPEKDAAGVPLPMFPLYVDRDRRDVEGLALTIVRNASGTTITAKADGEAAADRVLAGYVLDTGERREYLKALSFVMPERAGVTSMRMRIDASNDLVNWHEALAEGTLVDLEHDGRRLTKDRIETKLTRFQYVRLSWRPGSPVIAFTGVLGVFGFRDRPVIEPREWQVVSGTKSAEREGDYEYDLGAAFPIDRVALDLAQANSIVPATVLARNAASEPWQPAGSTVFYRIQNSTGDIMSPPLAVDGPGRRYWLLRIDPRAGLGGAAAPVLRAGWRPPEIVFAARGAGPFTLAYGKHAASPGALPIATLVPDYADRGLSASHAAIRTPKPVVLGGADRLQKPPDVKRWALWASLALGALVLGWMAWRLSREMTKGARETAESTKVAKASED